jgi:hypothetical protein
MLSTTAMLSVHARTHFVRIKSEEAPGARGPDGVPVYRDPGHPL